MEPAGRRTRRVQQAASIIEAEYRNDYVYHAQMEPLNAVASVSPAGDAVEIWGGTQSQTTATVTPAKFLDIPPDKIELHDMLMGGGFGRRGHRDVEFVMDAVMLSNEVRSPVKVMWTREDDVHNGRFQPISAHYLRAGLDASGKMIALHHRVAVRPHRALPRPGAFPEERRSGQHRDVGRRAPWLRRPASVGRACLPRHRRAHINPCVESASWPTSSRSSHSWTRSRGSAASIRSRFGASCSRTLRAPTKQSSA